MISVSNGLSGNFRDFNRCYDLFPGRPDKARAEIDVTVVGRAWIESKVSIT